MSFAGHTLSSLLGIYLEVELLGHRVGGMFSFVWFYHYSPTRMYETSGGSTSCQDLVFIGGL